MQFIYVLATNVDLVKQAGHFAMVNDIFSKAQFSLPVDLVFTIEETKQTAINNSVAMERLMLQAAVQVYRLGFKVRGLHLTHSSLTKELSEWNELKAEFHKQQYNVDFMYTKVIVYFYNF